MEKTDSNNQFRYADITGERFGKLTVIRKSKTKKHGDSYLWLCRCDCGNDCYVRKSYLVHGNTKNCGCYKSGLQEKKDALFIGEQFGRLTVIEKSKTKKQGDSYLWLCKCDCGNEHYVQKSALVNHMTKSCGCYRKDLQAATDNLFIGKRFGRLTVIEKSKTKKNCGAYLWRCKCDCGNENYVRKGDLTRGSSKSCGCYMTGLREESDRRIIGKKFGRLTVIEKSKTKKKDGSYLLLCKCDCGNIYHVLKNALNSGMVKSCGCLQKETLQIRKVTKTHAGLISSKKIPRNNTSGIKGVSKRAGKWAAYINFKKTNYHLGTFAKKEDAAAVRKEAEKNLFGPFLDWYEENIKSLPNRKESTKT